MTVTTALDHPFWCNVPECDFTTGWDHETGTHTVALPILDIHSDRERKALGFIQQSENYGTRQPVVYALEGIDGDVTLQELDRLIESLQEFRRKLPIITDVG